MARSRRPPFGTVRAAESRYARDLRKIARNVGDMAKNFDITHPPAHAELQSLLSQYADLLRPWARATSERMLADVAGRDAGAWFRHTKQLGRQLHQEISRTPLGATVYQHLDAQVELIRDIPIEAGRQIQQLALEAVTGGKRYADIIPEIRKISEMTENRATLIARTETGKASTAITRARAQFAGLDQYIWRTAGDRDVRPAHRRLDGRVFQWNEPPVAEERGDRHHPGEFPNCRCYAEPLIPGV